VGVVYGSNSVEVAGEKEKLAQLLFHRSANPGPPSHSKHIIT
jgi:hypothetical protein